MKQIIFSKLEDGQFWICSPNYKKRGKPVVSFGDPITGYECINFSYFHRRERQLISCPNYPYRRDFLRINGLKGNGWALYPISEGNYFVLPIDYPQYNPVEICAMPNPDAVSKKIKEIADTMFRFECNVVVFYHYGNPIEYIPSCKVAWTNGAIFGYNNSDFFDENDKNNEWVMRYEDALRG